MTAGDLGGDCSHQEATSDNAFNRVIRMHRHGHNVAGGASTAA